MCGIIVSEKRETYGEVNQSHKKLTKLVTQLDELVIKIISHVGWWIILIKIFE